MTEADEHSNADSSGIGGDSSSARKWMSGGLAWMAKSGGKALGYSVRATQKTGAVVTDVQRAITQAAKRSGEAAHALLVSTAELFPTEIPIGNRIRTAKRIRRLKKECTRLSERMQRKAGAVRSEGQINPAQNAAIRRLSDAIRLRAAEIGKLKAKLKARRVDMKAGAVSKKARRRGQATAATAGAAGTVVTGEAPATESPMSKALMAEASGVKGLAAKPPEAEKAPRKGARTRLLLERASEQATFCLASERLAFQNAVRDVQTANPALIDVAMESLKRINNPAVTRVLSLLAKDPRTGVRAHALNALTEQRNEEAIPLFQQAVNDSSARVRMAALRGLHKLGHGAATPYLMKALEDEDAGVRRRAVTCLTWAGAQEAVPNLLILLEDPETAVRKAVVDALGNLKSRLTIPGLIQALADEDIRVRRAAHETLKNLSHHTIVFSPEDSREDWVRVKAQWEAWWKVNSATFQLA